MPKSDPNPITPANAGEPMAPLYRPGEQGDAVRHMAGDAGLMGRRTAGRRLLLALAAGTAIGGRAAVADNGAGPDAELIALCDRSSEIDALYEVACIAIDDDDVRDDALEPLVKEYAQLQDRIAALPLPVSQAGARALAIAATFAAPRMADGSICAKDMWEMLMARCAEFVAGGERVDAIAFLRARGML